MSGYRPDDARVFEGCRARMHEQLDAIFRPRGPTPPAQRADVRMAMRALDAIHGPPPGGARGRLSLAFAETYERLRAEYRADEDRVRHDNPAVRVSVEGGGVLWTRGAA